VAGLSARSDLFNQEITTFERKARKARRESWTILLCGLCGLCVPRFVRWWNHRSPGRPLL